MRKIINLVKENPIKFVKLFSIISLIGYPVLSLVLYALVPFRASLCRVWDLKDCFGVLIPNLIFNLIFRLILLIPLTLFLVYICKFYQTRKTQILLPISYIVSLALVFYQFMRSICHSLYLNPERIIDAYGVSALISFGVSVFLTVDCFRKFQYLRISKILVIINSSVQLALFVYLVVGTLRFMSSFYKATGYFDVTGFFHVTFRYCILDMGVALMRPGGLLPCIAHLIFWNFAVEKRNILLSKEDLIILKNKFENGTITEEQYTQGKAEILNKL